MFIDRLEQKIKNESKMEKREMTVLESPKWMQDLANMIRLRTSNL